MNKTLKVVIWIVVLILVIWGISALSQKGAGNKVSDTGPLKIGVMSSLTGDAAVYGEGNRDVLLLAQDEINQSGGISGRQVQLIIEDSKCNGPAAASAAQKLINVDKVQAIIGGFCSGESLSAVPIAQAAKVALFSPGSSSPDLTGISRFFARDYPSDSSQGTVLADVAYNKENIKNVAFIQEQTDFASGVYKAFSGEFQKLGGTVSKEEFPTNNNDFKSQLTKLRASNPDALFVDTQTPAASDRVLKQLVQIGWKPRIILSDPTMSDPKTITDNKVILENALGAEFSHSDNSKFQHLVDAYKAKYNTDMPYQSYGQTEYDSLYILKDAIEAVGYDGTKIADYLHNNVKNWQGASGSVTIGSDGDRVGGHSPEIIKGGKVGPYTK